MSEYLLFQLYGPLASWGEVAVGEARVSATHPGRSALIGLLAAALGIRRDDEEGQQRITQGYRFAVHVLSPGSFLRDYHTAQVPSRVALKGRPHYTRRDELAMQREGLGTILSSRDYRCDAYYRIAVDPASQDAGWTLEQLQAALLAPRFPLFLGRKSCPPALPLQPQIVTAPNLREAFAGARFTGPGKLIGNLGHRRIHPPEADEPASLYWDDGMEAGEPARETFTRRDQPRTRRRWQFDERLEHHATLMVKE